MDQKMLNNSVKKNFTIKRLKLKNWVVEKMKGLKKPN